MWAVFKQNKSRHLIEVRVIGSRDKTDCKSHVTCSIHAKYANGGEFYKSECFSLDLFMRKEFRGNVCLFISCFTVGRIGGGAWTTRNEVIIYFTWNLCLLFESKFCERRNVFFLNFFDNRSTISRFHHNFWQ